MSHQEYVDRQRSRLGTLARQVLAGEVEILDGVRRMLHLAAEGELCDDDPDRTALVVVVSETDELPIGAERANWAPEVLDSRDDEVARARQWAWSTAGETVRRLADRFPPAADAD